MGQCKSWTLDCGLEYGSKNGLDYGLKTDSRDGYRCASQATCSKNKSDVETSKNQPGYYSHYACSHVNFNVALAISGELCLLKQ